MSVAPIWELGDGVFFAVTLFASFALLTGLSFLGAQTWKPALFRALVYLGAGLACLIHAQPFAPGFSLDFREVPLALASSFMGAGWGLAVGTGLAPLPLAAPRPGGRGAGRRATGPGPGGGAAAAPAPDSKQARTSGKTPPDRRTHLLAERQASRSGKLHQRCRSRC